jgi:hypothetical protein
MEVCKSLGVMEGLQRLDQLCAQQGIHGTHSNVAPWCVRPLPSNALLTAAASHRDRTQPYANPRSPFSARLAALTRPVPGGRVLWKLRVPPAGGLAPEAAARKQRMALKLAERQRLVDLVAQVSDSNLTRLLPSWAAVWVEHLLCRRAHEINTRGRRSKSMRRSRTVPRSCEPRWWSALPSWRKPPPPSATYVSLPPSRRRELHTRFRVWIKILKACVERPNHIV